MDTGSQTGHLWADKIISCLQLSLFIFRKSRFCQKWIDKTIFRLLLIKVVVTSYGL